MARSIDDINPFFSTNGGNLNPGEDYNPFQPNQGYFGALDGSGGGGGGVYTPPVEPNPLFVPPSYSDQNSGSLKIVLTADEPVEFVENDISVGFGNTVTLNYTPSLTFGNSKIYKANIDTKISKNYFEIKIKRAHSAPLPIDDIIPFNGITNLGRGRLIDTFNQNFNQLQNLNLDFTNIQPDSYTLGYPTNNDILYRELITYQEFVYNEQTKEYEAGNITSLDSVNGIVNINFSFLPKAVTPPDDGDLILDPPPLGAFVDYNIDFVSNYTNELGQFIRLKYQIVSNQNDILDFGDVRLDDGNIDTKSIEERLLLNGNVNINIEENYETVRLLLNSQNLPEDFSYVDFYWAPKTIWESTKDLVFKAPPSDLDDYTSWNKVNKSFRVSGTEFASGIVVGIVFRKQEKVQIVKPIVQVLDFIKEFEIKDSDVDKTINIPFTTTNTDYVDVYITEQPIRVPAQNGSIGLSFKNDFQGIYGSKIIYFVPYNRFGRGETVADIVKFTAVNDFPSIIDITLADTIDIPVFSDLNIEFEVSYNSFAATSVDVFILNGNEQKQLLSALPPVGSFTVNVKTVVEQFLNGKQTDFTFIFIPYNRGGVKELEGNPYEVQTKIVYPTLNLTEDEIKNSIFQVISENLKFNELGPDSKYLTHLVNFGDNEQIIISSWEEDDWTLSDKVEDELGNLVVKNKVDSLLLKLYSPLPADVTTNSTLWITKLLSNPLIETVILTEQDDVKCPPIKGPNFSIDYNFAVGQSTNFESLDNLILSSSVSASSTLVANYLSASLVDTDDLNIQYYSGSNYLTGSIVWKNFVHFSSAKERVDNFIYKIQLIEAYDTAISASYATLPNALSSLQERERQNIKKEKVIQSFDGFEKFLYTSSSVLTNSGSNSITWPYDANGTKIASTSNIVSDAETGWYTNLITAAENFDIENQHYIQNNIPQYILQNSENSELLLFFSMIGHHFDNIYFYTKSIENSRNRGYKKTDISERLLYDTLASFGWDAKNISANSKLWEYALGLNSDGGVKNSKSPKDVNNEIWRRILNNLPYLLKNKGTKRGIYALMACYGVPSSNLSILEFGGPESAKRFEEENEVGSTKVLMDNTTYVLTMETGSKIEMEWKTTDKGEKPKTIELFVKPSTAGNWTVLSGSAGWELQLSGSEGGQYGRIKYVDGGNTLISSSILPIFNDRFFGISISSGSYGIKIDTKQVEADRTIFENSYTSSEDNTFGFQTETILIGDTYTGSLDEFRLWSTPLSSSVFFRHVLFPEMINGNHLSSSTEDLYFRLDFEYPKNLSLTSSLMNVDTNVYFSSSLSRNDYENNSSLSASLYSENSSPLLYATASGFYSATSYPYNFEPIERTISLEVPNIGATRYSTNKVRFESQTDLNGNDVSGGVNLSIKNRATKKAFDQSPMDSNRIGLLFSPTKELNIDIAKSFGGINLDDYIGDPSDEYKENYKDLQRLRKYYFQRIDGRDVYQYINLIKSYEKSLFEDIKKMLPARVKATTGLLIEPHILERSTIKQSKPTGEEYQQNSTIDTREHILAVAENNQFETNINTNLSDNLTGENNQLEVNIISSSVDKIIAENYQYETPINVNEKLITNAEYYQKEVVINAVIDKPTVLSELDIYDINTVVGQSEYETIGFGIYAENGHAIRTYLDKTGKIVKERIKVDLVTEEKERVIRKFAVTTPAGLGDPRGGYVSDIQTYTETKLNIQPYSGSKVINPGTGSIVDVKPVSGYLGTHYRNTSDLTTGMRNSYYLGSKNTAATTLDGTPPVETFATNPNTLKVNRAGRDASEPILEVE